MLNLRKKISIQELHKRTYEIFIKFHTGKRMRYDIELQEPESKDVQKLIKCLWDINYFAVAKLLSEDGKLKGYRITRTQPEELISKIVEAFLDFTV